MNELPVNMTRIKPWEEALGFLHEIIEVQGFIIAKISHVNLLLPRDLGSSLTPHIGKRIGILRTDDIERPYRYRVIN